jgi:RNA polymerase sigma-70 factor (ECF subfamily)
VNTEAEDPDIAAMLRLQGGDDLALNEIMSRWQRPVTSFLYRLTGDQSTALDLAEETFVQIYQSRSRYRPSGSFSTWIFSIASNLFRNLARWRRRHSALSIDTPPSSDEQPLADQLADPKPTPAETALTSERAAAVQAAVLSLPDDQRQTVVLFEYERLSHEEIGKVMNCSAKAAESRLYRARAALREKLGHLLQ